MPAYTVSHVAENTREWSSQQGGPMVAYKMTVKDPTGAEVTNVEWSRKKDSPAPKVGETVDGEIATQTVDTRNGPMQVRKFKKAQQGGFGGGGYRPRDPAETAAIQRQHSQSVAVEYLRYRAMLGDVPGEWKTRDGLRELIDWFQRDIEDGVRLSQQPGYGQPRRVREPVKTAGSDVPEPAPGEFEHPKTDLDKTPFAV